MITRYTLLRWRSWSEKNSFINGWMWSAVLAVPAEMGTIPPRPPRIKERAAFTVPARITDRKRRSESAFNDALALNRRGSRFVHYGRTVLCR